MSFNGLRKFIDVNQGKCIEFGTHENAPSDDWIERAESHIGCIFPPSYVWFLKNYGGGTVHGDEIFSIYEMPFDEVVGGDIVFQTITDRRKNLIKNSDILICSTDFGEQFLMDTIRKNQNGEYPIVKKTGNTRQDFSPDFGEFIVKLVGDASVV